MGPSHTQHCAAGWWLYSPRRLLNWASVFTLLFSTYCTTYVQWACQFCYDAPMSIFHGHTLVCTALRCVCISLYAQSCVLISDNSRFKSQPIIWQKFILMLPIFQGLVSTIICCVCISLYAQSCILNHLIQWPGGYINVLVTSRSYNWEFCSNIWNFGCQLQKVRQTSVFQTVPKFWFICLLLFL